MKPNKSMRKIKFPPFKTFENGANASVKSSHSCRSVGTGERGRTDGGRNLDFSPEVLFSLPNLILWEWERGEKLMEENIDLLPFLHVFCQINSFNINIKSRMVPCKRKCNTATFDQEIIDIMIINRR